MAFQPTAFQNDQTGPIKAFQVKPLVTAVPDREKLTLGTKDALLIHPDPALGGRGSW